MAALHRVLDRFFALLLDPFARLPPLVGLTVISAISGVVILFAFRATSRPAAIRSARQRAQAHLLAVRLYREDLGVVFRAQRSMLGALLVYLGNMIVPFLVLLVPFGLLFGHLEARYGSRALHPGENAVVTVFGSADRLDGWRLDAPAGIAVDSPAVHIPARGEIDWRIRATAPGCHVLALADISRRVDKEVCVSASDTGAAPQRSIAGLASLFLAPTEAPIDAGAGIQSISIAYPPLHLSLLGWHVHWIVVFLVVSALAAFVLRKRAGVEF